MKRVLTIFALLIVSSCHGLVRPETSPEVRPNILLVVFEDMSPRIGALGDLVATTPVLDQFASQSVLFPNTFTTAGVCAPSRAALITGVHQQSLGAQNMRTHAFNSHFERDGFEIGYTAVPPSKVKAFPELMRASGYYTFTGYGGWPLSNKKDYQFGTPFTIWDMDDPDAGWKNRKPGQPFFGMVSLVTTHESFLFPTPAIHETRLAKSVAQRNATLLSGKQKVTDPADVIVPPWLPDTPDVRAEIAAQYDNIAFTEQKLALLLEQLEGDGLADDTIIIVTTDHGDGFPRAKRSVYDSGIRVPLMIRFPDNRFAGTVRNELVSFVDLAPTILSLAGVPRQSWLQGRNFLGPLRDSKNQYVFAASDRMSEFPDRVKAVRDQNWKLIRNYEPGSPFYSPIPYREELRSMQALRTGLVSGALNGAQSMYFETPRAEFELYNLNEDPDEMHNLAGETALNEVQSRLSAVLDAWVDRSLDWSSVSEEEMVRQMWPDGYQPETGAPDIRFVPADADKLAIVLSSRTEGASLAWRSASDVSSDWHLYHPPQLIFAGTCIEAKAQRYGYAQSEISRACALSLDQ